MLTCTHSRPLSSFSASRSFPLAAMAASLANITMFWRYHHFYPPIFTNQRANQIQHPETVSLEKSPPMPRPLLVDVTNSALSGYRSRKQSQRREIRQSAY